MGSIKFAAVTVGFSHSCGWTKTGDAYCWGDNSTGQLGIGGANAVVREAPPVDVARFGERQEDRGDAGDLAARSEHRDRIEPQPAYLGA